MSRKHLLKMHGWRYEKTDGPYDKCVYCGDRATLFDHVPGLTTMDNLYRLGLSPKVALLVPACVDCNSRLVQCASAILGERRKHVAKSLKTKYNRLLKSPAGDSISLRGLGYNLASAIRADEARAGHMQSRYKNLTRVRK